MFDLAARIILFPILALQGVYVWRTALSLPDAAGDLVGHEGTGPNLHLLIVGDSSAAGVGTFHQDDALLGNLKKRLRQTHAIEWVVCAQTGATTQVMLDRLKALPAQKFDVVSVSLGVNDITKLVSRRKWRHQYSDILDLLETKFGARLICVSGIPEMQYFPVLPQPLRWVLGMQADRFDRTLRTLLKGRGRCRFVPMDFEPDTSLMSEDGFHPGPKIYAEWGRKVYRAMRKDVSIPRQTNVTG